VAPAEPSLTVWVLLAVAAALLPLLLVGDLVAVAYRRHASMSTLLRLLPGVLRASCSVRGSSPWSTTAPCGRRSALCCRR
jgi:hypothetical protein